MAFKTLSRATAIVAACVILAGCVAPHQHEFDEAISQCAATRDGNACAQANMLGRVVEAEKAEQAQKAAAVAAGLLAVTAAAAAGYAASQPHYVAAPVYVYCPYGC